MSAMEQETAPAHLDPRDLARWCAGAWDPAPPATALTGVSQDSRRLNPGALYVALQGQRLDGHDFVEAAFAAGAAAALVQKDRALKGGPLLRVEETRRALHGLASGHRAALPGTIVGVTGSVGKTTVKEMLADMLAAAGTPVARTFGNWNNDIGLPLCLLGMSPFHRFGVFELGISHPGEMAGLAALARPDWAVFTPLGPAHLEFFGSMKAIAREKSQAAARLPSAGGAVLSRDDPWFDLLAGTATARVVTVTLEDAKSCDFSGREDRNTGHLLVEERATGTLQELAPPLPGRHMLDNALRAYAAARSLGIAPAEAAAALAVYQPLPGRWTRFVLAGVDCIDDAYNANPLSMRAAVRAFARIPVQGRRWLALGAMRELGPDAAGAHRALGRGLAAGPWAGVCVIGPDAAGIADGLEQAGASCAMRCATPADAADALAARLASGDALLAKASRSERLEILFTALRGILPPGDAAAEKGIPSCSTSSTS